MNSNGLPVLECDRINVMPPLMHSDPADSTVFRPPATDFPLRTGPAPSLTRRELGVLALLVLLTFLPRLAVALQLGPVCDDGYFYLAVADAYERGELETAPWYLNINLYPILLAGFAHAGLDPLQAGKVWSVAVATLTVLPLFGWLRRLLDTRIAVAACGLYAVQPEFIEISAEPIRDATFWLLAASSLYFFWRAAAECRLWLFLCAGVSLALAAHTRTEGWLFAMPAVAWPIVFWSEAGVRRRTLAAGTVLAFAMTPLLVLLLNVTVLQNHSRWEWGKLEHFAMPYRLIAGGETQHRAAAVSKPAAVNAGGKNTAGTAQHAVTPPQRPTNVDRARSARLAPGKADESDGDKAVEYLRAVVHTLEPVVLLLMLAGSIAGYRLLLRREHLVLTAICVAMAAAVWLRQATLGEINGRYFLTCFFPASGAAGIGVLWVLAQLERGWAVRLTRSRAAVAAATVMLVVGGAHVADVMAAEHPSRERQARYGRQLGDSLGSGKTLIVLPHACRIGYYAGERLPVVVLDNTPIELLLARHDADVVILEHDHTPSAHCRQIAARLKSLGWKQTKMPGVPDSEPYIILVEPSSPLASADSTGQPSRRR
jgi:hypothetical protein